MSYYSPRRSPSYSSHSSRPSSLYGSPNSFGSLGHSSLSQSSPFLNTSNYSNSYSSYGGTTSGYGSLLVPSASPSFSSASLYSSLFQNLGSRSSSPSYSSYSPTGYGSPTSSRYPSRSSSFNRHGPYKSSRVGSNTSLPASEGYESGTERSPSSSRKDSTTASFKTENQEPPPQTAPPVQENGEIDYKKLYEESQLENERLREKLRRTEDDLQASRLQGEKASVLHKNSISEAEKRERRAMERKLSEMEEELKQLQKLKADNERLRSENRALTRVLSNLTASSK